MKQYFPFKIILMAIALISIYSYFSCSGQNIHKKTIIQQGNEPTSIWLEAENGKIETPMIVGNDKNTGNGKYIHQPAKEDPKTRLKGNKGSISISCEVPVQGHYTLWARVYYIDIDGNSFYCRMDDQEKTMLGNALLPLETWHWIKGDAWKLEKGRHTLQIEAREEGARIDQILLTTLPDFIVESVDLEIGGISSPKSDVILKRGIITEKDTVRLTVTPPPACSIDTTDLQLQILLKDTSGQAISQTRGDFIREYLINTSSLDKGTYIVEAEIRDSNNQLLSQPKTTFWLSPSLERFRKRMSKDDLVKSSFPTIEEWIFEIDNGIVSGKSDVMRLSEKIYRAIEKLDRGQDPFKGITGWLTKAYISSIDDTRQPYLIHIPKYYNPQKSYPLAIYLHGVRRGARHFRYMLEELAGLNASSIEDMILVSVEGRGTHFYDHIAEEDLFSVLREVKYAYSIDEDRICLWGQSMGGWGTYSIACKYPHLWAALAPSAGGASENLLENIVHIPIHIYHGEKDHLVPVRLAYSAYNALKSLGADVNLIVYPDVGHQSDEVAVKNLEFWEWLKNRKRSKNPKHVVYSTNTLRHNKAYWLSIDAFQKYDSDSLTRVEAEIQDRHTIGITTTNVAELSLFLNNELIDVKNPVTLFVNGNQYKEQVGENGRISISVSPYPEKGLVKRHGISGPYGDQFYERFIIVYGTKNREEENRKKAMQFATWENPYITYDMTHVVKSDKDVTREDIQNCHLILLGMPDENSIMEKIKDKLPIQITSNYIQVDSRRFEGNDLGIRMIYPNPLNQNKYVVIHCGLTSKALDALPEWVSAARRYNKQPEIVITDGGENPVFTGYFNEKWHLDNILPLP